MESLEKPQIRNNPQVCEESDDDDDKSPEENLLFSARHGDLDTVNKLLTKHKDETIEIDINCRGVNKANLGWTPLHLASYFGHVQVVAALLEHDALVDVQNDLGDTPLHRAAYTGRLKSVMLLLKHNANVNIKNIEGNYPKNLAKTREIKNLIEAAEAFDLKKTEEEFLNLARNGDIERIAVILKGSTTPNINCVDRYGNTALHWASYGNHNKVAVLLLQNGIDPGIKNQKNQTAIDLASNSKMKQVLDVRPIKDLLKTVERYEGPLLKKSRLMGWKPFWVVIDKGVLSLFKTRADATTGTHRKGCKYLDQGRVESQRDVIHILTVNFADKSKYSFAVEESLTAVVKRQKWENVLSSHIAYASQLVTMGGHISDDDEYGEDVLPLGSMQDTLQTAEAHQQVMEKQIAHVAHTIKMLADERIPNKQVTILELRQQLNCVLTASQDMCINFRHCLTVFTQQEQLRKVQLQQETEKSRVLEEALHALAEEHHDLECSVGKGCKSGVHDSEDEDFFDCNESRSSFEVQDNFRDYTSLKNLELENPSHLTQSLDSLGPRGVAIPNGSGLVNGSLSAVPQSSSVLAAKLSKWNGRSVLPVPMLSKKDFSVWTFLKQCIGKELSKITMPVIFNEPLSFVQRMAEYMEYSDLLQSAAQSSDPVKRMELVAAFAVSSSASNLDRVGKPFNPLLGETYELNRPELGYKFICEQVLHHPPVSAFHVESPHYRLQGSIHPKLKFWGKSVEASPKGTVTLHLLEHDEVYTWENVVCCIHNIIVGKLWIEHYGTMEITNHKTGHQAVLNFKPSGWFGRDLHKIEGYICSQDTKKERAFSGKWIESLYSHDIKEYEKWLRNGGRCSDRGPQSKCKTDEQEGAVQNGLDVKLKMSSSSCDLKLKNQRMLWQVEPKPPQMQQYYNFTLFAMMLNEMRDENEINIAPTDSRLRPDIRKLEQGDLDGASAEKHRLEEKQRASRKLRKDTDTEWIPRWFKLAIHPETKNEDWIFTGEYWKKDRGNFPDIF